MMDDRRRGSVAIASSIAVAVVQILRNRVNLKRVLPREDKGTLPKRALVFLPLIPRFRL